MILFFESADQGRYDEILKLMYGHLTEAEKAQNPFAKALSEKNIKKFWEMSVEERLTDPKKSFSPLAIAGFYAHLGEKEKTLEYLEKASESPKYDLSSANPNPLFDTVRKDSRFVEVMKKINLHPPPN